jgi:hypothetical protein
MRRLPFQGAALYAALLISTPLDPLRRQIRHWLRELVRAVENAATLMQALWPLK